MFFNNINEKNTLKFIYHILSFYQANDDINLKKEYISKYDKNASRKNYGWYKYVGQEHYMFLNIPYILKTANQIKDKMDMETFYAFLALIVGHEYRHFMQGTAIWNRKKLDDFSADDLLNTERILYIKFFYDAYYYLNKNNFKYELDALKYAIVNGINYLDNEYPNINAKRAMLKALKFYEKEFALDNIENILALIDDKALLGERHNLKESLIIVNNKMYGNHGYYGLNSEKVLTEELVEEYNSLTDSYSKDKLVFDRIQESLVKPYESLKKYPALRMEYLKNMRQKKK